ncbi:MAG: hypothetical protein Q8905_12650, partial [Bacteroidota bacterium]|nr:hypothetical protein [Bacteroidota bacterium]
MATTRAVTSGDIQFSREGEKKPIIASDLDDVSNWALNDAPRFDEKFVVFKLVDNTKDGGVHIDGIDDIMNPTTKKVERARVLAGIDSIWLKDQKDLTPEYIKNNQRRFSFPRGAKILRIQESDHTALEFLRGTRHNITAPNRKTGSRFEFYEYNPAKQQEEALKKEMLEIEMAIQASKEPEESMRKHANYLGIQAFDELGFPKSEEGIRREYILVAKRNPVKFKRTLNSKEVEVSYLLKKAISENLIDLG